MNNSNSFTIAKSSKGDINSLFTSDVCWQPSQIVWIKIRPLPSTMMKLLKRQLLLVLLMLFFFSLFIVYTMFLRQETGRHECIVLVPYVWSWRLGLEKRFRRRKTWGIWNLRHADSRWLSLMPALKMVHWQLPAVKNTSYNIFQIRRNDHQK